MGKNYDFSGWATRANLLCSDGRIIKENAFEECDGVTVPLVWNHKHNNPEEVLGHALLENREEGVYAYCTFNNTENGQLAKELVQHGDINQLSIFANKLKHMGRNVIHGVIREVSLVHAGANPGAYIDSIIMHGDDSFEEGAIYTGEYFDCVNIAHADDTKKGEPEMAEEMKKPETATETVGDVLGTLTEKQKKAVMATIAQIMETQSEKEDEMEHACGTDKKKKELEHACGTKKKKELEHVDEEDMEDEMDDLEDIKEKNNEGKTVEDVLDTLNEEQKTVVYALIGMAREEAAADNKGGKTEMKHNVFDQETNPTEVLSHAEMAEIFEDAKKCGSLRDAVLAHGIEDIDILFPDAQAIINEPEYIKRDDDWVAKVLAGVHHSPFARVKTVFADITADEARAKGYVKGNIKLEEVIKLLKRVTNPTTVYKKQKLDRDDMLDITDFNVVPWMKAELRMMLNEELGRAILIGDGRSEISEDKINEDCIRPIWKMEDLFTIKAPVTVKKTATADERARAFIKACVKTRKDYKGSGNPSMFMPEDILTDCLLIEDANGRVIYDTEEKLRARLRVKEIIPVPVMENQTRTVDSKVHTLAGIYVNLADYNVGTNKGGEVTMFDDFDIDYNAYKYLLETRCSGTLTKPFSAVALEFVESDS